MKTVSASKIYLLCGMIFVLTGSVVLIVAVFLARNMNYIKAHGEGNVKILPFIFAFTGGVAFLTGIAVLTLYFKKRAVRSRLIQNGDYVMADITGAPADYRVRVNRIPTYRLECCYQDPVTSVLHVFKSDNLLMDPSRYLSAKTVRVYVDRKSGYQEYYVDIESILPEIRRH